MTQTAAPPIDRTFVRADGRTLSYFDLNPEGSQTLIHLHGGGTSRYEGLLLLPHALERGWRIIVPDRPGYGLTSPMSDARAMAHAEDVLALADHLSLDRFSLSGWSAGGPSAAAAAILGRGRVDRMAVVNSAADPRNPAWQAFSPGVRALLAVAMNSVIANAVLPLMRPASFGRMIKKGWSDEPEAVKPTSWLALDNMFVEGARQGRHAFKGDRERWYGPAGWGFTYADAGCPVTFIHGERDMALPFIRAVAAATPGAHLVSIPGGHVDGGRAVAWRALFQSLELNA